MENFTFFRSCWTSFESRAPRSAAIYRNLDPCRSKIDHVAFRTLNIGRCTLDILEDWLLAVGYKSTGDYSFPNKCVRGRSYSNKNAIIPRIFLSELLVEQLTDKSQKIINQAVFSSTFVDSKFPWCNTWLGQITTNEYNDVIDESGEYAGWVLTNGTNPNHFAVSVNEPLIDVVQRLKSSKIEISTFGGEIKGSESLMLEQASSMADIITWQGSDGKLIKVPSAYCEFARRWFDQRTGSYYDGFVEPSADKIFHSTDVHKLITSENE